MTSGPVYQFDDISQIEMRPGRKTFDHFARDLIDHRYITVDGLNLDTDLIRHSFFEFFNRPDEVKSRFCPSSNQGLNGYIDFEVKEVADYKTNYNSQRVEVFGFTKDYGDAELDRTVFPENLYPFTDKRINQEIQNTFKCLEHLARLVIRVTSRHIYQNDSLVDYCYGNENWSILRFMYYQPLAENDPRDIVVKSHIDNSLLTIMTGDSCQALQVESDSGHWYDPPNKLGSVIIGFGEMMEIMTSGRVKGLHHRVKRTSRSTNPNGRISMPFFAAPHPSTLIQALTSQANDPKAMTTQKYFSEMLGIRLKNQRIPSMPIQEASQPVV